jgi:hypothetical protein
MNGIHQFLELPTKYCPLILLPCSSDAKKPPRRGGFDRISVPDVESGDAFHTGQEYR